ncbi:hypothetical protein BDN70DRAFT_930413 [Pholiota conissans]|uniref:Uncharacterized protein n=1 Tax=Pholiota conissans TaxID=109636 RepID=A0A9P5Z5L1_9AGAR|nr:hypothetical protein BDN70DRAFT_930413 [Pholiota conissans]
MHSTLISSDDAAARNRFENFKLGNGLPATAPIGVSKHGHSRSHSRNLSISSSFSFPPSKATTLHDTSHFSLPLSNANLNGGSTTPSLSPTIPPPCPSPTSPNLLPASKRNSHHRRRSSVSTRHESAEMMGVALPDLPLSTSDDNINLGEKDSIRRRALWALEGKPDVSFNKVEIPDISTPDMEKIMFDFSSKASSTPSYGNGLNAIMGSKRDSFKLLGTSSSAKDQLHTLVEEEEEEEESINVVKEEAAVLPSPASSIKENVPPSLPTTPVLAITKPTPSKPRPSNLNLRPLSLTPDNLIIAPNFPSPSPTPSPRSGLRSLSLTPSSSIDESSTNGNSHTKQARRTSLVISPTPTSKRPVLNLALEQLEKSSATSTCDEDSKSTRRSSISYKRSSHGSITTNIAGLPTPEMTPTFGRRYSNVSASERESISSFSFTALRGNSTNSATTGDDDFFPSPPTQTRPLSASEQHFLFKSHNALLARITDLERALMMRRRESGGAYSSASSRPISAASSRSSVDGPASGLASPASSSEPSDEMLRLIADLKAERDELKRDADGWRTRVSDMETQLGVLAKRVENERREAWVARSRVGLLEVEKGVLSKKLEAVEELNKLRQEEHTMQRARWEEERTRIIGNEDASRKKVGELEAELDRVRKELEVERLMKNALIKEHAAKAHVQKEKEIDPLATPTPRSFEAYTRPISAKTHGLGFASLDSESSITDVELDSFDDNNRFAFKLGSVQEESETESERGAYTNSEDTSYDDEEESGLAGYEDEDENDTDMSLQSSSSFDSEEDLPRTVTNVKQEANSINAALPPSPTTPTPNQVFTPPRPSGHERRATLSKTWTFPFGAVPSVAEVRNAQMEDDDEQDRFFGCLDDGGDVAGSVPSSPSAYSYEKSKGAFARGFKFAPEDDNASFFVPGIGFPSGDDDEEEEQEQEQERRLSVVAEEEEEREAVEEDNDSFTDYEEEDDSEMFGDIGGIRITFTPPQEEEPREERAQIVVTSPTKRTSPPPTLPALDFGLSSDDGDDDDETLERCVIPFSFGRSLLEEMQPSPPPSPLPVVAALPVPTPMETLQTVTPPPSVPRAPSPAVMVSARPPSPSMIPRPASPLNNSVASSIPRAIVSSKPAAAAVCTPSKPPAAPARAMALAMSPTTSFITPPTKRGGALPSFIPTPVSSPSPIRTASTGASRLKSAIPTSTFIRQPTRKPLLPTTMNKAGNATSASANVLPMTPPQTQSQTSSSYANCRSILASSSTTPASTISSSSSFYNIFDLSGAGNDAAHAASSAQMKSVDLSHDHTFSDASVGSVDSVQRQAGYALSSIVTSPFKSLTNFMPHTWATPMPAATIPPSADTGDVHQSTPAAKVGGYVSREKQLRKLQTRMNVEGVVPMINSVNLGCKSCNGALVRI